MKSGRINEVAVWWGSTVVPQVIPYMDYASILTKHKVRRATTGVIISTIGIVLKIVWNNNRPRVSMTRLIRHSVKWMKSMKFIGQYKQ